MEDPQRPACGLGGNQGCPQVTWKVVPPSQVEQGPEPPSAPNSSHLLWKLSSW